MQRAIRLKEPAARWFFQQLVIGLDYCHRKGVVNRDIKLENTLLQMVPVSIGASFAFNLLSMTWRVSWTRAPDHER